MPRIQLEGSEPVLAAIGLGVGIYFFIAGFKELKSKRIIQNTPTARINTGAVGTNVEVAGKIISEKDRIVKAPISGTRCVFYSIEIQRWKKRRRGSSFSAGGISFGGSNNIHSTSGMHHGHWVTVENFYSHKDFHIGDNSGANARVLVDGAVIKRKGATRDYEMRSNNFDQMPAGLRQALEANQKKLRKFKMKKTSWIFSNRFRFREWSFSPGERIFVLGHAESGLKVPKRNTMKFKTFLKAKKMIQEDEKLQSRFDTNQDGRLDEAELERGAKMVATQLATKQNQNKTEDLSAKTKMVFRLKKPFPFYISNMSEKELLRNLSTWSAVKIWGGPLLSTGCAAYLYTVFFP